MSRPGKWQRVHTEAGWHLRLVGANGEPVLTTEVYVDREACDEALELVRITMNSSDHAEIQDVDE